MYLCPLLGYLVSTTQKWWHVFLNWRCKFSEKCSQHEIARKSKKWLLLAALLNKPQRDQQSGVFIVSYFVYSTIRLLTMLIVWHDLNNELWNLLNSNNNKFTVGKKDLRNTYSIGLMCFYTREMKFGWIVFQSNI